MVDVARAPYEVRLDGTKFRVRTEKYTRRTIPPIRPQVDQGNKDGEGSLTNVGNWRRSQRSFHGGAGQRWADEEDSSPIRYHASVGVDPSERGKLKAHQQLSDRCVARSGPVQGWQGVHPLGQKLVWVHGQFVSHSAANEFLALTWTDIGIPANVAHSTDDGGDRVAYVYGAAATGGGYVTSAGLAHTAWTGAAAASNWSMVKWAAGRLFVGTSGGKLREVDGSMQIETPGMLSYQHRSTSFQWVGAASGPDGMYFYGTTKRRSQIFRSTYDETTGNLGLPKIVAEIAGEVILCATFLYDTMFIGTSRGFHVAQVGASGGFSFGPLIQHHLWQDNSKSQGVASCTVDGPYVVFGFGEQGVPATGAETIGVGRADLTNFVAPLQPAYWAAEPFDRNATKLPVGTAGSRNYGDICSIHMVGGYPFCVTGFGPGALVPDRDYTYPPGTSSQPGGGSRNPSLTPPAGTALFTVLGPDDARTLYPDAKWVSSGLTWGVTDPKKITIIDVHTDPIVGGELAVQLQADTEPWATIGAVNVVGSTGTDGPALVAESLRKNGQTHRIGFTFRANSAGNVAPSVDSWALLALANPARAELIEIGLVLDEAVQARNGGTFPVDPWKSFTQLKTLETSGDLVEYVEGDHAAQVRIDSVEFVADGFDDRRNWWRGTAVVTLITVGPTGGLGTLNPLLTNPIGDPSAPHLQLDNPTHRLDSNYRLD